MIVWVKNRMSLPVGGRAVKGADVVKIEMESWPKQ